MYHDEFSTRPARRSIQGVGSPTTRPLEFGGGLSLGLAASLNHTASVLLIQMGGLLPLVGYSIAMAVHGLTRHFALLARPSDSSRVAIPAPHLLAAADASRVPIRLPGRARSARRAASHARG